MALRHDGPIIWPSMLMCDFARLADQVHKLDEAGFKGLHLDVMDGVFVPNFSYGMTIVKAFRQATSLPLDVHLMMAGPDKYVKQFCDAGADSITFHIEAVQDAAALVNEIHDLGMAAGVAVDRDTPIDSIRSIAESCDLVLVMTIKAGFGGQSFIPKMLDKVRAVCQWNTEADGTGPCVQVDGGVNESTIAQCVQAGAQWMVVGSGIFRHDDFSVAHQTLNQQICLRQG